MVISSDLVEQLKLLSQTQDPYFKMALHNLSPIRVHTLRRALKLQNAIKFGLPGFTPVPKDCFGNALTLAGCLESIGVKYVEGFVLSPVGIQTHAWISHEGRYFDPTYEHIARLHGPSGNWRQEYQYGKIIELRASEIWSKLCPGKSDKDSSVTPPISLMLWGFGHYSRDFYSLKNNDISGLVHLFSDPQFYERVKRPKRSNSPI